jgi:hypothetical protein
LRFSEGGEDGADLLGAEREFWQESPSQAGAGASGSGGQGEGMLQT